MKNSKKKLLFVLYVLLLGVVLLYMLFPADAVCNFLVNRIQYEDPELRVSIGHSKLAFPPALSLKNVVLSKKQTVLISADQLKLTPGWISLLTSNKVVKIRAKAYQGELSGVISSSQDSENARLTITGNFSELQLEKIPMLQEKSELDLSGRASGQFHFDEVTTGKPLGDGNIFVNECRVNLSNPILEIDQLNFQSIDLAFIVEGNKVALQHSDFQGSEVNATLSGNIIVESPTEQSVLDLDIFVTPQRLFLSKLGEGLLSSVLSEKDGINLRVTGSIETPRVEYGAMR